METKFFLKSTTVWGGSLLALLSGSPQALVLFVVSGINYLTGVNLADQVAPLASAIAGLVHALPPLVHSLAAIAASVTVIAGRIFASKPLHFVPKAQAGTIPGVSTIIGAALLSLVITGGLAGCGATSGGSSTGTPSGSSPTSTPTAAQQIATTGTALNQNLLALAETQAQINQTLNAGTAILAPQISEATAIAGLVVHGSKATAVINKVNLITTTLSANAAAQGLPPPAVQAVVSAATTPTALAGVVQSVTASSTTNSN